MKKSRMSVFGLLLVALMCFVLVGCKKDPTLNIGSNAGAVVSDLNYAAGTELKLSVAHNNTATTISFEDSSKVGEAGLKLADGKTYFKGDLKPVWAELQSTLNVKFTNVYSAAGDVNKEYSHWQEAGFEGVDVLCGNTSAIQPDGRSGKLVDLSKYLDLMPNFTKFLSENPIVYLSILADTKNGAIYFAPYFDGFDDIEKYFLMRTDWLEILLDGEGQFTASASDTYGDICKEAKYTPYMATSGKVAVESLNQDGTSVITITKDYGTTYGNIVDYMNKNVKATTTGVELVNMLRGYIDAAYNGYYGSQRSRLFSGYDACWDADELVALLRCVVTNTQALTGQNKEKVTGLFPRQNTVQRMGDLINAASMFGIRGYESRNGYLYFNKAGEVVDARGDVQFAEAMVRMNQMKQEGLIMSDFYTTGTKDIMKGMYQKNLGFMIYDYCQTQSAYNTDATALAAAPNFNLSPVMTPVAKWNDGTGEKVMRFTESWRSVKTGGWSIPAQLEQPGNEDKLKAALKMFDYAFSTEGNVLMSYGPSAWRSGKTTEYKGNPIPELSAAALAELKDLASGNYTNYARMYLGSTLPIGFVKDQGMEYQCTTEGGRVGSVVVGQAIAKGTVKHVVPSIQSNLWYTMVPTTLPTTEVQDQNIKDMALIGENGLYSRSNGKFNIFLLTIANGLGAATSRSDVANVPNSAADLAAIFSSAEAKGTEYTSYMTLAWNKLKAYYESKLA